MISMNYFKISGKNLNEAWRNYAHMVARNYPCWAQIVSEYLNIYLNEISEEVFYDRYHHLKKNISESSLSKIRDAAEILNIDFDKLLSINLIGDIARPTGCSTMLHKGANRKIIIGHNLDWPDFGLTHQITSLVKLSVNEQNFMFIPGFAGILSIAMGINAFGVGVFMHDSYTLNQYSAIERFPIGISLFELLSKIENAETLAQSLSKLKFPYGTIFFVIDKDDGYLIEHGIHKVWIRKISEGETIYRTNHFMEIGIQNIYEESCNRLKNLKSVGVRAEKNNDFTMQSLYDIITNDGVFRKLTKENVDSLMACSIHSIVYEPQQANVLSSFITDFPCEKPKAPKFINLFE